jgi:hypothetical protein
MKVENRGAPPGASRRRRVDPGKGKEGGGMRATTDGLAAACRFALGILLLIAGCASSHPGGAQPSAPQRMITDILTIRAPDSLTVVVQGDQPLAYALAREETPPALIITFPDTGLDRLGPEYAPPDNFAVQSIRIEPAAENGKGARVVLGLKGSLPHRLAAEENSLKIVFTRPAAPPPGAPPRQGKPRPPAPAAAAPAAAGVLQAVTVAPRGDGAAVFMRVAGRVKDYRAFAIDDPPAAMIVVDLPGLRSAFRGEQRLPAEGGVVKQVRHFGHPDKVRVVVETAPAYLKGFAVEPVENGIVLKLGAAARQSD